MLTSPVNWPGAMDGDERLGAAGGPDDLEPARRDHEERHVVLPGLDEHLAALDRAHGPCAAMRAICAGVSVGNVWLAGELSRAGSAGSAMVVVSSSAAAGP